MPTVHTTIVAHLHNPEPGSTIVKRLEYGQGSFIVLDFTGGELGTPDLSALFPTWDHAVSWVHSIRDAIVYAQGHELLAQRVADEIGAPA